MYKVVGAREWNAEVVSSDHIHGTYPQLYLNFCLRKSPLIILKGTVQSPFKFGLFNVIISHWSRNILLIIQSDNKILMMVFKVMHPASWPTRSLLSNLSSEYSTFQPMRVVISIHPFHFTLPPEWANVLTASRFQFERWFVFENYWQQMSGNSSDFHHNNKTKEKNSHQINHASNQL